MRSELAGLEKIWQCSSVSSVEAKELLLVTDFDGTLAEIGPDPARSAAFPEALETLRRLSHLLKQVVVLSSRTSTELSRLVPVSGVRLIGDSGLAPPTPDEKRVLDRFNAGAAELLRNMPGARVEIKPASTTVHLRHAQVTGEEAMALLGPLLKATGLLGAQGRKVIDVHSPLGGKGAAVAALLDEVKPGGVIALGDDENDRSAFEVLSARPIPHLCIGVSSPEVPPDLFDRCDAVVAGPRQATAFLQLLADWASAQRSS